MKLTIISLIFTFNFFFSGIASTTVNINDSLKIEGEILYCSESCIIIKEDSENQNPLIWVLAEIVNLYLPDVSKFICLQIVGEENQEICEAIYNGLDLLTSLAGPGRSTYKICRELVEYTAERQTKKSTLYFASQSLDLAYNIKNTIEAYQKLGYVNWDKISDNYYNLTGESYVGQITIQNKTNKEMNLQFSKDGVNWYSVIIPGGKYKKIDIWDGRIKQNYGLCKGDLLCNYQVFTDRSYQIRYNKSNKTFSLVKI